MAFVSISEAARLARKSRSTLYKTYIDAGRLSVSKDTHSGKPVIDTSELIRVFGEIRTTNATGHDADTKKQNATTPRDTAIDLLRQLLKSKEEQIATAKEQINAANEREEWMRKQVDEMTGMLRLLQHKKD